MVSLVAVAEFKLVLTDRSTEVMAASEPVGVEKPTPVFLVREDGLCIIPTGMQYP